MLEIVRGVAPKHPAPAISPPAPPAARSSARTSRAASKCAASTSSAGARIGWLRLLAEAESFAQAKIQSEAPRAFRIVDGDNQLAGLGGQIKATVGRGFDAGSIT